MYLISYQFDLNHGSSGIHLEALVEVLQSLGLVFRYAVNILEKNSGCHETWSEERVVRK